MNDSCNPTAVTPPMREKPTTGRNKPSKISQHQIAVPRCAYLVFLLPLCMLPASCSHRSGISHEELRSIVRSSIALASDADMSLDYLAEGRSTQSFANGHFRYIAKQAEQNVRKLSDSRPSPGIEQDFQDSQEEVKALASELASISSQSTGASIIRAAKQHITEIRRSLIKTSASL